MLSSSVNTTPAPAPAAAAAGAGQTPAPAAAAQIPVPTLAQSSGAAREEWPYKRIVFEPAGVCLRFFSTKGNNIFHSASRDGIHTMSSNNFIGVVLVLFIIISSVVIATHIQVFCLFLLSLFSFAHSNFFFSTSERKPQTSVPRVLDKRELGAFSPSKVCL